MRVLHVISGIDPRTGGPATALLGLTTAQARLGLNVSVLATYRNPKDLNAREAFTGAGVALHAVGPVTGGLSRHPSLAGEVDAAVAGADVVHIHAVWEEIQHLAARAAKRRGIPYIFRPCGMLDPWSLNQSKWKKRLYMLWRLRRNLAGAAALHFTTATERDLTARLRLGTPAIVEPNGVDLAEYADLPAPGAFRHRYPQIGSRPLVLFMSRLHAKKGLDLLIPAFAAASDEAVLVIAGPDEGGYQAEVEKLVRLAGLGDRVLFPGMIRGREKVAALADADLFVLPSYQENFGNVVVESLAAGTPVVISDQVNLHDEITAAGVGGVVPTQTAALSAMLRRWLTDTPLRQAAADKARPFVRARFDWQQIATRWEGHYRRLAL